MIGNTAPLRKDRSTLTSLLNSGALSDEEETAFRGMLNWLEDEKRGARRVLSERQRQWANNVYEKLHLDRDETSLNLVSSGIVPKTKTAVYDFERMPKPLKPPGRK